MAVTVQYLIFSLFKQQSDEVLHCRVAFSRSERGQYQRRMHSD